MTRWSPNEAGVLELPSGRTVRGRRSRRRSSGALPDLTLHLSILAPRRSRERTSWILWPDFGLPVVRRRAVGALLEAWDRSARERVDIECRGGRGRTGTALACLAVLDGLPATAAIALVRERYDRHAVETPWQRHWVGTFHPAAATR